MKFKTEVEIHCGRKYCKPCSFSPTGWSSRCVLFGKKRKFQMNKRGEKELVWQEGDRDFGEYLRLLECLKAQGKDHN